MIELAVGEREAVVEDLAVVEDVGVVADGLPLAGELLDYGLGNDVFGA